jgi:hypothetical protein
MVTKVREVPAELIPHIATIKEIATTFGIDEIRLFAFAADDLPYTTAVLHLYCDVLDSVSIDDAEDAITNAIGMNTIINNKSSIIAEFRDGAYSVSVPL